MPSNVTLSELLEQDLYWGLTLGFAVLAFGLWIISIIRVRKIYLIPESTALLIIGVVLGVILRFTSSASDTSTALDALVQFNGKLFFIIFLPPIVFEAAYNFRNIIFADNVLMICLLAFLGTTLTMIFTGFIMYGIGQSTDSVYRMSLIDNMIFGAGISATDPVAVLIVFSTLGADAVLFALVLGESVLNDAVALVLYQTMSQFQTEEPSGSLFIIAILVFCGIFLASMAIGAAVGLVACFLFKHMQYSKSSETFKIESGLMIAIPYLSYFLAQAAGFSGITSISFCGIVLSEWAHSSFSKPTKAFLEEAYGAVAQIFEAFTFIFMGIAFVNMDAEDTPVIMYALSAFGAIIIARILHVLICVFLGNLVRPRRTQINWTGTFALCVVGLRGPMAFFVGTTAAVELVNKEDGQAIKTATIIIICLTTPLIGIFTPFMVKALGLTRPGSASEGGWWHVCCKAPAHENEKPERRICTQAFTRINNHYLKPFLSTTVEDESPKNPALIHNVVDKELSDINRPAEAIETGT